MFFQSSAKSDAFFEQLDRIGRFQMDKDFDRNQTRKSLNGPRRLVGYVS